MMRGYTTGASALAIGVLLFLAGCSERTVKSQHAHQASAEGAKGEVAKVADMGDFWMQRATYPTGHFNPQWQVEAARELAAIETALPAGVDMRATSLRALDPANFTPLGPRPLGDTSGGGDAIAGRINVVLGHPTNPAVAWVGSDGGGIWKTTNCCSAATTWQIKTDIAEIQNSAIGDMTLDPNNADVLYAATGDLRFGSFSFGSNGVLKSTDAGETWVVKGADVFNPFYTPSANAIPQYQAIGQVEVDPNDGDVVIAGTKTGLYLSYDGGDNWTGPCLTNAFSTQRQDTTGIVTRDLGTTTELIVAIGTRGFETPVQPDLNQNGANGIYRGTVPASGCPADFALISRADNGWPAGSGGGAPTPANTLGRIDIAVAPTDNNVLYAQVARVDATTPNLLGVWRSTDGGNNWTQRTVGDIAGAGTQSWYNAGLTISPVDSGTVILSAFRTFRSTAGGTGFTSMGSQPHVDHHGRSYVANNPDQLLIGTDGGVYFTANARAVTPTWVSLNATLNTIEFYSGTISANFNTAATASAVGGAQDNSCMLSNWSGGVFAPQTWNVRNGGDGFWTSIEPILGQRWYYSSQNGNIRVTNAAQATGTVSATPSGWGADRKSFVTNYDLYRFGGPTTGCPATGCGRIIAGSFRVWESVSGGVPTTSWLANSPDLTKGTLGARSFINQVSYATSTPSVAIAGTNDGNVAIGFNMGQNVANSATWVDVTGGNSVLPNRPVLDVFLDPVDPLIGYASVGGFDQNTPSTPGHLFQVTCTANCASFTWRNISGNLPNIPANSVVVNPNRPRQVFAGTDWGLFYTDDVTANPVVWSKHAGLPSVMIWDMNFDRGFTTLAVWTRSRGAWVWPLPASLPVDADLDLAASAAASVVAGRELVVTRVVTNDGPNGATGVSVAAATPAGVTFVSNAGACTGAFPCALGDLASGATRTITTTYAVPANYGGPASIATSATVSATAPTVDPTPGNNTGATTTSVAFEADLDVTATAPSSVVAGATLSYTITLTTAGPSRAASVEVAQPTPAGLEFVSNAGDCTTAFPCTFANLMPGAVRTITATFRVPADYTAPDPIASSIGATGTTTDPAAGNNTASVDTSVAFETDVGVAASGPAQVIAGSNVVYTLTINNAGRSRAASVDVALPTPAGLTFVGNSGGCVTTFPCTLTNVMPGTTRTITATFLVPADYSGPTPLSNTVTASSASADPAAANNSATVLTPVAIEADVGVTASAAPRIVRGSNLVYTINVANAGLSRAASVTVADPTPAGLVFVGNGGACTSAFPCVLTGLMPGESRTITATFQVPAGYAGAEPIVNTVTASSAATDPASGNNSTTVSTILIPDALFSNGYEDPTR